MRTIADILLTCDVGDSLSDRKNNTWVVHSKDTDEDLEQGILVIALPNKSNKRNYELWSSGLESDVCLEGLHKIKSL